MANAKTKTTTAMTTQRPYLKQSLLAILLLVSVPAWADTDSYGDHSVNRIGYKMPSADRPPVYDGGPISVPVKALIERLALGVTEASLEARRFRYDIDTLGQGVAVRLHFKF